MGYRRCGWISFTRKMNRERESEWTRVSGKGKAKKETGRPCCPLVLNQPCPFFNLEKLKISYFINKKNQPVKVIFTFEFFKI